MIQRTNYINIINHWWERNDNTALFVLGPVEVGKTTLIMNWASNKDVSYRFFDEKEYELIKDVFLEAKERNFDVSLAIVNKLFMGKPLEELLIFDGVMPGDEIIVQLKNLCANSRHRFILISDYGEYVFEKIRFIPVGSISKLVVKPLSFKEYCLLKTNRYSIDSVQLYLDKEDKTVLPFSRLFESFWEEYSNYGGFPSVVEKVMSEGNISAEIELLRIKKRIISFVEQNIPFSSGPAAILNKFNNGRSTSYRRFIFSSVSENGTLQRYKRSINILERMGIISVFPFVGDKLVFEYCDLYLCDPGLERIWGEDAERKHIVESIVFNYGVRKGCKPYRFVLADRRIIDIAWDYKIPTIIEIKLKNTNSLSSAVDKLNYYRNHNAETTYKPVVLVDKGIDYVNTVSYARIFPIWAFLLGE